MDQRKRLFISLAVSFVVLPPVAAGGMYVMSGMPVLLGLMFFIGATAVIWVVWFLVSWLHTKENQNDAQDAAEAARRVIHRASLQARRK